MWGQQSRRRAEQCQTNRPTCGLLVETTPLPACRGRTPTTTGQKAGTDANPRRLLESVRWRSGTRRIAARGPVSSRCSVFHGSRRRYFLSSSPTSPQACQAVLSRSSSSSPPSEYRITQVRRADRPASGHQLCLPAVREGRVEIRADSFRNRARPATLPKIIDHRGLREDVPRAILSGFQVPCAD